MHRTNHLWKLFLLVLLVVCAMGLVSCNIGPKESTMIKRTTDGKGRDFIEAPGDGRYLEPVFESVSIERDIPYIVVENDSGEEETLHLDLYQPSGDTAKGRPAIIWVHGGYMTTGSKDWNLFSEQFARKGYVCLSIDYRLRPSRESDFTRALANAAADAWAAMEWAVAHSDEYGIDPGHIAFGGHSAGGHICTALCYHDEIGLPTDKAPVFCTINISGGYFGLGSIGENKPPCIVINGDKDNTVPHADAKQCVKYLKSAGVEVYFHTLKGCGHGYSTHELEVEDVITKYLYKTLTGVEPDIPIRQAG